MKRGVVKGIELDTASPFEVLFMAENYAEMV